MAKFDFDKLVKTDREQVNRRVAECIEHNSCPETCKKCSEYEVPDYFQSAEGSKEMMEWLRKEFKITITINKRRDKMARPNFPNCVMTDSVIRGVIDRQQAYDKDPKEYERREKEREEEVE